MEGFRYFIVDDFSPFTCIHLLQKRSKIFYICKKFSQTVRNQFSKTIKIFWSHNALKYNDKPFLSIFMSMALFLYTLVQEPLNIMVIPS